MDYTRRLCAMVAAASVAVIGLDSNNGQFDLYSGYVQELIEYQGASFLADNGYQMQYSGSAVTSELEESLDYAIPHLVGVGAVLYEGVGNSWE